MRGMGVGIIKLSKANTRKSVIRKDYIYRVLTIQYEIHDIKRQ